MTDSLESMREQHAAGKAPDSHATARAFVDELVRDIKRGKHELRANDEAVRADKEDGKLVRTLRQELKDGKLHPKDQRQFNAMLDTTLHDAHKDLWLEAYYKKSTEKTIEQETRVLTELCKREGVKLPNLEIEDAKDTKNASVATSTVARDLVAAHGDLSGAIDARALDDRNLLSFNHLTHKAAFFKNNVGGIDDLIKSLAVETLNNKQDKRDETKYQIDAEMRMNIDRMNLVHAPKSPA